VDFSNKKVLILFVFLETIARIVDCVAEELKIVVVVGFAWGLMK
jgi:hypothetical protein